MDGARRPADGALAQAQLRPRLDGRAQAQAAQMPIGLALVVEACDRLLADIAALCEAHRALVQAPLLGDDGLVEVDPVARPAMLDADVSAASSASVAPHPACALSVSVSAASQMRSTPVLVRPPPTVEAIELGPRVGVLDGRQPQRPRCGPRRLRARDAGARRARRGKAIPARRCACAAPRRNRS